MGSLLLDTFLRRDPTVSVRLMGGLGNQMFQYAAGAALSDRTRCRLSLDTSFLRRSARTYTQRSLELHAFNIQARVDDVSWLKLKLLPKVSEFDAAQPVDDIERLRTGAKLRGYWQNERHFASIRDRLLVDFSLEHNDSDHLLWYRRMMVAKGSVAIHVRRGDYVANAEAAAVHGTCSLDYYRRALSWLREAEPLGPLFVFSDDVEWVRKELDLGVRFETITASPTSPAEDIVLMSECAHHVIANSSFSWWGAWLSVRGGMKVAPRKWNANSNVSRPTIVPGQWLCI